ncbi:UxaA family hydrolase [Sphingomonas hengshuiensis]|uniref:Altronate hydrolase n=1 Tax=Sphingomonas hengshuiensis TaxID=1609977 RepID=A0A7U4JAI9_9SPHN|nr:UxaA family hydrolase [Sphingomonas hengshuiensis]AJP73251.1 altronate hydrolase [Sphingomonas hengshuiensis]
MTAAAIRISPSDNVAVACRDLVPGETIRVEGMALPITEPVALGHKISLSHLEAGDKIIKYGMPIGSATAAVPAGGWVHIHNMQSDYIPAHLRDAAGDHS